MPTTPSRELVLRPEAMAQVFKPARIEICESLQVAGPATIATLAERLGRPADSLYYHVRKLIEIGVVEQTEAVAGAGAPGRNGAVYGMTAKWVTMKLDAGSRKSREVWGNGAAAVLRLAQRDVRAALDSGEARTEGVRRNLWLRRLKVRLDDRELKEINAHLNRIEEILRGCAVNTTENTKGRHYAVTMVMTPLEERTRR